MIPRAEEKALVRKNMLLARVHRSKGKTAGHINFFLTEVFYTANASTFCRKSKVSK
jgi:hypothetical protein